MAWDFNDSFDPYTSVNDPISGYWDSASVTNYSFVAGRFAGSQAISFNNCNITKSSGVNDAVHHIVCSIIIPGSVGGSALVTFFTLLDGTTAQCSVVFRSDGAILLTSGGPAGTVLDTWVPGITVSGVWTAFEFEVVINNTTGSWAIRKGGNTSNDHVLGSLDTQNSANAYANKLTFGANVGTNTQNVDDLYWRSGSATGGWLGDLTCYTRVPANDVSVQFHPSSGAANFPMVSEAQEDGLTSYVYSSNPSDIDLYGLSSISATPTNIVATTVRAFGMKSDIGTRTFAAQLKSGSTTVVSPTTPLSNTNFLWSYRTDIVDPATGVAWTPTGVNNAQIGPKVVA